MRKILLASGLALALQGCADKKWEEVRPVTVASTYIEPGDTDENDNPQLHVNIVDDQSQTNWDIKLGETCAGYPFPPNEKFMVRFSRWSYKDDSTIHLEPKEDQVKGFLCGS